MGGDKSEAIFAARLSWGNFCREATIYCGVQNYSVSGFIIFELFTVISFQDWARWGIFAVSPGNPRRTKGDSQHLEARPELQDWLRSELFTVKNDRTGPFSNYLGNNFELYSTSIGPLGSCL